MLTSASEKTRKRILHGFVEAIESPRPEIDEDQDKGNKKKLTNHLFLAFFDLGGCDVLSRSFRNIGRPIY